MAHDESGGVRALVRYTAGMAELAIHAGHPDRKHNEYLPYPDENFNETVDQRLQRANKFTIEHIHNRGGQAFVPNLTVIVKSITADRTYAGFTEFLNPYLYCITVEHGRFEWCIYKRYRHFHDLHKALLQSVLIETKRSRSDLENRMQEENNENPCFPTRNDRMAFINDGIIRERCEILIEYLNKVLKHPKFRSHSATREFFGVSCLSFVYGISVSRKEGYLLKRSHDDYLGRHTFCLFRFCPDSCKCHHDRKWFAIKDTYLTYLRTDTHELRFPMLVDRGFQISTGLRNAATYRGVRIENLQRTLVIKCRTTRDCDEWKQHLLDLIEKAKSFVNGTASRFNSYAPKREKQLAYWFINGKSYMEAIAKALLTAKEEVFITDWWLSPEIMLIRPSDDETFRLDNILARIADAGVRVYVMIYKEMSFAVSLNSAYTKRVLNSKNNRGFIKVIRHPDHYPNGGVLFWSHHEKMVVIDQKIAFVGGIDLCYGRWDDDFMRLVDLGEDNDRTLKLPYELTAHKAASNDITLIETAQQASTRMVEQAGVISSKRNDLLRAAFSGSNKAGKDIKLAGQTQSSGKEHKMKNVTKKWMDSKKKGERPTSSNRRAVKDDVEAAIRPEKYARKWMKLAQKARKHADDSDDYEDIEDLQPACDPTPTIDRKHRFFIGKDYSNAYEKDFEALDKYSEDYIARDSVPRMPWHDEALVVFGSVARDVARHFIQRWNIHKCEKSLENDNYPFLLPKSYDDTEDLNVRNWKDFLESKPFHVDAQCVRSVGPWSIGTKSVEHSIQNAYIQMIDAAKHFIYIENQFFITISQDSQVRNQLADTLFRRIERAHQLHEKFRIYVVLPLLPGFDNINAVQAVLFFIMRSITKGDSSLLKRLERAGIPADDYISFFGMRNHDILMGRLVSEIIYVHSKLMIVDDHMAICGSANINDRSLLGQRDSEFCMVINDREEEKGQFNGKEVLVGKFCSSWRKRLFAMLLGILCENPNDIDVADPVSDEFYHYFRDVARKNTLIYEEVFATLPTDRVKEFSQVDSYTQAPKMQDTDPLQAQQKLKGIQGLVVAYPLYFLDNEDYLPSLRTPEGLVPNITWT
ncbi:unnamed protein product [Rotaria socialis]|uniref:Phospholipase n=1 Tax=Rotaria socialis TaxID=392032 RepID=A0A818GBM3_9BILA|nr:unnamed protein product [Rotaria socialis]